jgi:RNA polymerase sigma-70 factor (ECF subfamily)
VTVSGDDDEALAARAISGDPDAFDALTLRYQARVYRLACRMVGVDAALDVVQDSFLAAYRHLASFRGQSRFGTWLYRIATNAALMHRRANDRRPTEPLDAYLPAFEEDGTHRGTPERLRVAAQADQLVERRMLSEKLMNALDRLPDLYRAPFVLRDLEELSTQEVAAVLDIEPAAVRQRVHRARLMLRGYLGALAGGTL